MVAGRGKRSTSTSPGGLERTDAFNMGVANVQRAHPHLQWLDAARVVTIFKRVARDPRGPSREDQKSMERILAKCEAANCRAFSDYMGSGARAQSA